tara:strand:+ start:27793 stop:27972 length:180 start_codon:yes stop_codon:yes gene_type:complete
MSFRLVKENKELKEENEKLINQKSILIDALKKIQINEFVNIYQTIEKVEGIQTSTSEEK